MSSNTQAAFILKVNGDLYGFGVNNFYQLGNGTTVSNKIPKRIASNVKQVSSGDYHTLILKKDEKVYGAGYGANFSFGNNSSSNLINVTEILDGQVKFGSPVKKVFAGNSTSFFMLNDGRVAISGYNADGQLANGTVTTVSNATVNANLTGVSDISTGLYNSAYIIGGEVYMSGKNDSGQIGNGVVDNIKYTIPTKVTISGATLPIIKVTCGDYTVFALDSAGNLWGWGDNAYYQLNTGNTTDSYTPVLVYQNVKDVSIGKYHQMIIKDDNSLWMWGYGVNYRLGNNSTSTVTSPFKLMDDIKQVQATFGTSYALTLSGEIWAWGYNTSGQVGINSITDQRTPIKIEYAQSLFDQDAISILFKYLVKDGEDIKKYNSNPTYSDTLPTMTSDNTSGVISSASNVFNTSYPAWRAFNNVPTDYWASLSGSKTGWIQLDFGITPKIIRAYTIFVNANSTTVASYAPKSWTFEGSNDGLTWNVLQTTIGQNDWLDKMTKYYEFVNSTAYRFYRINISENNGGAYVSIYEIELLESPLTRWATVGTGTITKNLFLTQGFSNFENIDQFTFNSFINNPIVYSYIEEENPSPKRNLIKGVAKNQLIFPTQDIDLSSFKFLNSVTPTVLIIGEDKVKMIASVDSGLTWKYWNNTAGNWSVLNQNDLAEVSSKANPINIIAQRTRLNWTSLLMGSKKIRFAYLLEKENINDEAVIDKLEINVDNNDSWKRAIESQYDYEYPTPTKIIVTIKANGTFKINY